MPTYRGPVKASLAQLAAIAPFLAKSAFASNLEVRTVEVFATTYLDIDACYNACPTKAWQEWQTPVTNYVTQTLPAAESCVTTSTSTKHPDCDVCKGTVFIYVPKTEIVEITKVIDPTHSSHMHKPSFSKHTEHSSVVVKSSSTAPPSSGNFVCYQAHVFSREVVVVVVCHDILQSNDIFCQNHRIQGNVFFCQEHLNQANVDWYQTFFLRTIVFYQTLVFLRTYVFY
ncbi:hypothetical protein ED733_003911 [Metarhizium rileyi]|uniref:Uncharacterized protein n=1 Tax=Metarhizium rileyi (strain RCEF 4871) TaxID=1649241 RepID=A0A5C6G5W0_METRR|nr:hypothetical protein ED733_003911 [Metarhizium rileyi]